MLAHHTIGPSAARIERAGHVWSAPLQRDPAVTARSIANEALYGLAITSSRLLMTAYDSDKLFSFGRS